MVLNGPYIQNHWYDLSFKENVNAAIDKITTNSDKKQEMFITVRSGMHWRLNLQFERFQSQLSAEKLQQMLTGSKGQCIHHKIR